jgi:ABC-2 type transport system ATP-binding protein
LYDVEARGLTKSFRDVRAVDDLDVLVEQGDVVALLGPNGAGKTTTLMMLLGIIGPDAGTVTLLGHPLPRERSKALARANFPARYGTLPGDLRGKQYLWVYADLYGVPRSRAMEMLELFRVGDLFGERCTCRAASGPWSDWRRPC